MQNGPKGKHARGAAAALALLCGALAPIVGIAAPARADTLTMSVGAGRSSWYPDEPELAPSNINQAHFGQRFSAALDGQIYAQPLVSKGTLLAVTENNSAYGLNATTGAITWHHNYGTAFNPSVLGCGDLVPKIGITATPVIDPATNVAYFTSKVAVAADSSSAAYLLHAVKVGTGVEQPHFPVLIGGKADNDPTTTFDPVTELQRPGLALVRGVVYMGFGGHCDHPPYAGWVIGVSTKGGITSRWVDETKQVSGGAGIWQSGAAPVVDGAGNLYVVTGNGTSPANGPALGHAQPKGLGECVVKLNTATGGVNGKLSARDWFCPSNAEELNSYDGDFGSGGPAELPGAFESKADQFPMLVVAGKSGFVYLLNMNNLGGVAQGPGGTDNVVSEVGPYGGVWSKPAVWPGGKGYVYLPTASGGATGLGSSGKLLVFQRVLDSTGHVSLSLIAKSSDTFGFSSSSPVVTSDGTTPGSAVLWIIHANDSSGVGATLRAYEAVPEAGQLEQIWSAPLGSPGISSKFNPPAVDGGRVFVGTRSGTLLAFGARSGAPKLRANTVQFTPTSLGSSSSATATFTATGAIKINSLAVQSPGSPTPVFAHGTPSPSLPVTLQSGQKLHVPMTFRPSALGLQTGTLTANTGAGAVNLTLSATGTAPTVPIGTSPSSLDFGTLRAGGPPSTSAVAFTNTGTDPFTVTGLDLPGGPFTVLGAPATDGSVTVQPGDSIGLSVKFTPPTTSGAFRQTFTGQVTMHTSVGNVLVPVKGAAAPPPQISISPTALKFGTVAVGHTSALSFTVSNAGGSPLTILKSKPPVANRFAAATTLAEGTVLAPGAHVRETVRLSPTVSGPLRDKWIITGDDGSGAQTVQVSGRGARLVTVPPPDAGGWTVNGAATLAGHALQLTPATKLVAGSAFWPSALPSATLDVAFDTTMGGGSGADGITLAFADAGATRPTAVGGTGGLLGFGGIPGVAVALHTYPDPGNAAHNAIGIVTGASAGKLHWTAIDGSIPKLRIGMHHIEVRVANGIVSTFVDGLASVHQAVKLPPRVYLGFTGATGGLTDVHRVSDVQISAGATGATGGNVAFRAVGSDGGVFVHGSEAYYGSTGGMHLNQPIVGMATDPKTGGYWLVASDGGVFAFHAGYFGSTGAMHLNQPIVGMASTADGGGYWLVARDGGVFAFGDAQFHGSTGAMHLNSPIVGMAVDAKTGGYWLVASDGGVFSFDAPFLGSMGGRAGPSPTVGMAAAGNGGGYWLATRDGAVFPFGAASGFGRAPGRALPDQPVVGITLARGGGGYLVAAADGAVFGFGTATFDGDVGVVPNAPIVGIGA